jgi:dipeptidyl-peptidase-4
MNFRWFSIYFLMLILFSLMNAQETKKLTIDDIFASDRFKGETVENIRWLPDGSAFTLTRDTDGEDTPDIYRHIVKSGKEELILKHGELQYNGALIEISDFHTTARQEHLLLTGKKKKIWRHSFVAPFYLYDMNTKEVTALAKNDPELQNVALSPDGKWVAYVKNNNLYVADVNSGDSRQLTFDGSDNILNGVFDWVYEEEFGRADAYRWSPGSKKIAFWHSDQTRVKTQALLDQLPRYNVPTYLEYPKVGEHNAIVKIGVADIESGNIVWVDLGGNDDIYIPRMDWTNSPETLAIQRLNRKQNHLELLLADAASGQTRVILNDRSDTWVDVTNDFIFLKKTDRFVWTSEKSGFRHIYLSDYSGKELTQLTAGKWEVSSVIGVDESGRQVYFYGKKESPMEKHIYRVALDGKTLQKVSGENLGWHKGKFSPDYRYYVSTASAIDTPPQATLRKSDGELVRVLEKGEIPALKEYQPVYPEFFAIKTGDGVELNALMMKPADFDPNRKYPVIVYGYGMPGSQVVENIWGLSTSYRGFQRHLWHRMMTEKGYIIFSLDNRGTGGRGKAFKDLAYGDLSKWSVQDQIEGAKYLAGRPYVDASRIGFWGWSGGGYLTCLMLTRGADYFAAGAAVASVTDFRNYDTIWTERYMGLLSENQSGYDAANVNNYAHLLRGKLMLIHGSGDDNVHPQNTIQFMDKLIAENKQFSLMIYPNRNHRINGGNTSRHLYTLLTNYFLENL